MMTLFQTNACPRLRKRGVFLIAILSLLSLMTAYGRAAEKVEKYDVTGILLKLDRSQQTMTVSCESIPGHMDAMVMSFAVRNPKALDGLHPGVRVAFTLVEGKDSFYADDVQARPFDSLELDPTAARRLKLLENLMASPSPAARPLAVGQRVPEFSLTDQKRQRVTLSDLAGKVVAVTFVYTRCPFPNYCFRMSNNFGQLQTRFKKRLGEELVLLTVVIDPTHDQPEALADYARIWKADPSAWHFLTGPLPAIQQLAGNFDMNFYPDEALFVHSFHTVIIDRQGKLAANLEGNDFTAQQLGDLVETVLAGSND
jgi:protein SCO1